jgi:hypothetical protein
MFQHRAVPFGYFRHQPRSSGPSPLCAHKKLHRLMRCALTMIPWPRLRPLSSEKHSRLAYSAAAALLDQAAYNGSMEARGRLGELYITGRGVPEHANRGLALIRTRVGSSDPIGVRMECEPYEELWSVRVMPMQLRYTAGPLRLLN